MSTRPFPAAPVSVAPPGFWRMVLELGVAAVLAAAVSGAVVMTIADVQYSAEPWR